MDNRLDACDIPLIISNNCWGGEIQKHLNYKYTSPFVGLFLYAPCYIGLLEAFSPVLFQDLRPAARSQYRDNISYPLGLIDGRIEVHFVHYRNWREAEYAWARRSERMFKLLDIVTPIIKFCDRDFCNQSLIERFCALPFRRKILFSVSKANADCQILVRPADHGTLRCVPEGHILSEISISQLDIRKWIVDPSVALPNEIIYQRDQPL